MKTDNLQMQLQDFLKQLARFRILLFVLLVVAVYGFVILRIDSLRNAEPGQGAIASHAPAAQPHIDQATVSKIQQLQDNSVSVQALFNQARQNPFQE